MKKIQGITILLVLMLSSLSYGYTTNSTTLSREFDREAATLNEVITVTVSFSNGETLPLRGFYYTEQIPQDLTVTPVSVQIDSLDVLDYTFESGSESSVYQGATPYRWVFEIPAGFSEDNSIGPGSVAEIVYVVSSSAEGTFNLDEFSWAGYYPGGVWEAFGHSEDSDKTALTITGSGGSGRLSASGGGCSIHESKSAMKDLTGVFFLVLLTGCYFVRRRGKSTG